MSTLIEDLYNSIEIDLEKVSSTKVNEMSILSRYILGINNFRGKTEGNLWDIAFVERTPILLLIPKILKLMRCQNGDFK